MQNQMNEREYYLELLYSLLNYIFTSKDIHKISLCKDRSFLIFDTDYYDIVNVYMKTHLSTDDELLKFLHILLMSKYICIETNVLKVITFINIVNKNEKNK